MLKYCALYILIISRLLNKKLNQTLCFDERSSNYPIIPYNLQIDSVNITRTKCAIQRNNMLHLVVAAKQYYSVSTFADYSVLGTMVIIV